MTDVKGTSYSRFLNWATPGSTCRALSAYLAFLAAAQAGTIGISLSPLAITQPLALIILTVSISVGVLAWTQGGARNGAPSESPAIRAPGWIRLAFLCLCAFYAFLAFVSFLQPDWSTDGNIYHLPVMHFWTLDGRVHWIPQDFHAEIFARMNGFPKAAETTAFLLVNATGLTQAANLGNLLFLPLGILGIQHLSLRLGASPPAAALCGLLFILIPMNISQAPTTYVDTAGASAAIALFAIGCAAISAVRKGPAPLGLQITLGAAMGLAAGVKTTGLSIAAILSAVFVVWALMPPPPGTDRRRLLSRSVSCLAVASLAATLVGGYWYLRNAILTGSPLFPVGLSLGNARIFPGLGVEEALKIRDNIPEILRDWPMPLQAGYCWLQGLGNWPKSIIGVDARLGGLGFLWAMACLPSICITGYAILRRRGAQERNCCVPLLATVGIAFLVCPMNCVGRYTLWLYGLGLPCFAAAITRHALGAPRRSPWRVWLAACLAVCAIEAAICSAWSASYVYPGGWRALLESPGGVASARNWRYPGNYLFPQFSNGLAKEIFDAPHPVAIGPLMTNLPGGPGKARILGRLSRPIGERPIVSLSKTPNLQEMSEIRSKGIRYVLWDSNVPIPASLESEASRQQEIENFFIFFVPAISPETVL